MSETARRDTPKGGVVLIGRNDFQNKLLGRLIAERIGCSCLVRSIEDLSGPSVDADVLALLDVEGIRGTAGYFRASAAASQPPPSALARVAAAMRRRPRMPTAVRSLLSCVVCTVTTLI